MKTVRNITIMVGLSVALFALGAVGARGQVIYSTHFAGTFTLPFETQWGAMTLPAGDYALEYGMQQNGRQLASVRGKAKGSPQGVILASPAGRASATKNELICIRQGDKTYVRGLELPAIGESVHFAMPHGVEVEARILRSKLGHNANTQLTEVGIPIERVPVKANGK